MAWYSLHIIIIYLSKQKQSIKYEQNRVDFS